MRRQSLSAEQERRILTLLISRQSFHYVAAATGLHHSQVQTVAESHGYPDVASLQAALDKFDEDWQEEPAAPTETARQLITARVGDLHADPDNPRENLTGIEDLAASILSVGLLEPIIARRRGGHLYVVAGHRRLAAVKHLGHQTVDVIVGRDMAPDEVLAAMLVENGHRVDLDPIEEGRAYRRLQAQMGDCTEAEIARRLGRSTSHIASRTMLLALPAEEQEQVRAGVMSLTEATKKARLASGRIRPASIGRPAINHLNSEHPLAERAKARCVRLKHARAQGKGVGGVACGACWESVIRADERHHLEATSARQGKCALCDSPTQGTDVA